MLLLVLTAAVFQSQSLAQPSKPPSLPAEPQLTRQILQADARLFDLFFSGACDVPRLREMLAEGAEFYHDRKGLASTDEFVADYRKDCEGRGHPNTPVVRRELVEESLTVIPIGSYGAFQTGEHLFYVRSGANTPEKLVSRRRFALLWVLGGDGRWRLSRVVDYRSPAAR